MNCLSSNLHLISSLNLQSYALGEIPSLNDRITIVRQLWDLTGDVLVYTTLLLCVCVCMCMLVLIGDIFMISI